MPLRRSVLLLVPAALAACARGGGSTLPPPLRTGPPSYSHLPPIRLDVATLDIAEPAPGPATMVIPPAPVVPSQAMETMARDRIVAAGTANRARFSILTASLTRAPESSGGMFSPPTERLSCAMRCRLEILGPEGEQLGFAEAQTSRGSVVPAGNSAERAAAADRIVHQAMADLNVEFEFQIRRNLRRFLVAGTGATPAAVDREDLPRN